MLREFAPLITAIIIAGRSGSAYAAQIGTMSVTEEIDAMRTLGIPPLDLLVLPKIIALVDRAAAADRVCGRARRVRRHDHGARAVGRRLRRVSRPLRQGGQRYCISDRHLQSAGVRAIIAVVGCFQGFRTKGGADSVGRQTTRSVVQSIFLVIIADALFSIAFSALDL